MNLAEIAEQMLREKRRNIDIASELGMSIDQVKRIKKRIGMSNFRSPNTARDGSNLFLVANKLMKPAEPD